ncbi:siroheme synthase [Mucidula mucida]|nr:siroheme synthase [Mucidula mucida]
MASISIPPTPPSISPTPSSVSPTSSQFSSSTPPEISPVVGGTSLLVAWQLKGKQVLIVGGGQVASSRIEHILAADANIVLLAPHKGVNSRTKQYIDLYPNRITHYDRRFTGPAELHKMDMVLTALDDPVRSREIVEMCRQQKIPVNAADIPDLCDFYFGAQIRDGPLHILISTNGSGEAIRRVGELRARLKDRAPGVGGPVSRKRMKWMTQLCNEWHLEDLTQLDDAMVTKLLDEGWEKDRVPSIQQVGGQSKHRPNALNSVQSSIWPAMAGFVAGGLATVLLPKIMIYPFA